MRTIAFLHEQTLYFAVASPVGCVDFSAPGMRNVLEREESHPPWDAWILAYEEINRAAAAQVASPVGCVDFSKINIQFFWGIRESHPPWDAWILAILRTQPIMTQSGRIPRGMRGF